MRDPKSLLDKPFLYIDISSIDRSMKLITSPIEMIGSEAPSRARKEVLKGDVLVSTVRPNLNSIAMVPLELDGQIASTGFCVLRPNQKVMDGRYLFYFAMTPDFISALISRVRGAHYPAVSDGIVKNIQIPLPSLSEQRRIVQILDQADGLRKRRAEADAKVAHILPALFYKMFGDPAVNPMGWPIEPLDKVTNVIYRYPTFYGVDYVDEGVPVVRISDIGESGILNRCHDSYVRVPKEFSDKFPLTIVKHLDIVMAVRGDTTGKMGLVPPELEGANLSPNLIRISPLRERIEPLYLLGHMLLAKTLISQYITNTAKKSITASNIKTLPIMVPDSKKQIAFHKAFEEVLKVGQNREIVAETIKGLFFTLLNQAFTGNLTARWREARMKELAEEMELQAKYLV